MKPIMAQNVMSTDQEDAGSTEKLATQSQKPKWSLKRKLLIGGAIALVVVVALGVGLGVGLTRRSSDSSDNDSGSSSAPSTNATSPTNDPSFNSTTMWAPAVGVSWDLVLRMPLPNGMANGTQVWDIDLFDNNQSIITSLQQGGAKVICYFSAGSYEDWRPDHSQFADADLGSNLAGWEGERWLNVSSPNVRKIMLARMDMAVQKGCNGVDPDNVDGYDNDNGLDLTKDQAIDYLKYLANAAHSRGLSIGLKNAGAIIPQVLPYMQWSVNEQCAQFNECETYAQFVKAGKPVFHVEYPKGTNTNNYNDVDAAQKSKACTNAEATGFSTIIKNMILDLWIEKC